MKKIIGGILLVLLIGFITLQFFQPEKNTATTNANDLLSVYEVPENVALMLKESCYDCHSNSTRYLWYHKIAPVSWMVDRHIRDGKKELNFSEWKTMDIYDQIEMLDEMTREIRLNTMPLKAYQRMHPKANLSDTQIQVLEEWTRKQGESLLTNAIK